MWLQYDDGRWYPQGYEGRSTHSLGPQIASPGSTVANFGSANRFVALLDQNKNWGSPCTSTSTAQGHTRPRDEDPPATGRYAHSQVVGDWVTEQYGGRSRADNVRNVLAYVDQQGIAQRPPRGDLGRYAPELEVSDEGEGERSNSHGTPQRSGRERRSMTLGSGSGSGSEPRSRPPSMHLPSESEWHSADSSKFRKKRRSAK